MDGTRFDLILYSLRPLTIVENLLGKFRYRKCDGHIQVLSRKMKCYAALVATLSAATLATVATRAAAAAGVAGALDALAALVMLTLNILSTGVSLHHADNNLRIIKLIADIDETLNISNNKRVYREFRRHLRILLSTFIFFFIGAAVFQLMCAYEPLATEIILVMIDFERRLEVGAFCIFLKVMIDRLSFVNDLLGHLIADKSGGSRSAAPRRARDRSAPIRALAATYDLVGEACAQINTVFQFHIMKALFSTFVYILITVRMSIFYKQTLNTPPCTFVTMTVFLVNDVVTVGLMSVACEALLSKRSSTKVLVNECIMAYALPRQTRTQAKAFMELIEVWPLRIAAYDMFTVDISLMLKFISVSTTYLIVIIQMSHFF